MGVYTPVAAVPPYTDAPPAAADVTGLVEAIQDAMGAEVTLGGSGLTFAYDDAAGTITVAVNTGTGLTIASDAVKIAPSGVTLVQTANSTTRATVPAALNVGVPVLLADVITAVATLQDGINQNRELVNQAFDLLQFAGVAA